MMQLQIDKIDGFSVIISSDEISKNELNKELLTAYVFEIGSEGVEDLDESYFIEGEEDSDENTKSGLKIFFSNKFDTIVDFNDFKENLIKDVSSYLKNELNFLSFGKVSFEISDIEKQNWRENWKENFKPMNYDKFLVLPIWLKDEENPENKIKILIEPKMAFGTGTHETTGLMLDMIGTLNLTGKQVFDAGTGSGILAIASVKSGAIKVNAVDIDDESIDNTKENCLYNDVADEVVVSFTSEESYSKKEYYDVVLANINRTVLLDLFNGFQYITKESGFIILSGILIEEKKYIFDKIESYKNLEIVDYKEKNEWCTVKIKKLSVI